METAILSPSQPPEAPLAAPYFDTFSYAPVSWLCMLVNLLRPFPIQATYLF